MNARKFWFNVFLLIVLLAVWSYSIITINRPFTFVDNRTQIQKVYGQDAALASHDPLIQTNRRNPANQP